MVDPYIFDFNKEIIFGEVGAIIGAPALGCISSQVTNSPSLISTSAVIGSVLGAALFWFSMRVYDKKRRGQLSKRGFIEDIVYFTPVAFVLALLLYYPSLFLVSKYLIKHHNAVIFSVLFSQFIAFFFFIISINLYNYFLFKLVGKRL